MWNDVKYGLRQLARAPGFTAIGLVALAIGIGATTTVFTIGNAFLWRPLPAGDPGALVRVYSDRNSNTPYAPYLDYRDRTRALSDLAAFQMASLSLRSDGPAAHVFGEVVSGNYFRTLQLQPAVGRLLTPADDRPRDPQRVVVLSHAAWQDRFGGAPDIVGRAIHLNGERFEIVGVAPPTYRGGLSPIASVLWVPFSSEAVLRPGANRLESRHSGGIHMIGRLAPGQSLASAQAEFTTLLAQMQKEHVEDRDWRTVDLYAAGPLHPQMASGFSMFTSLLLAASGLLLLIACVNLANLLLTRASTRQREIGVRQALGAGRARLIRQLLLEHVALAAAGGALGVLLAATAVRAIASLPLPVPMPVVLDLTIDWRVTAFAAAITSLTVIFFGLAPAWHATRADVVPALKDVSGGRVTRSRLRSAFVVAQVACSTILLVAAGLAVRSLAHVQGMNVGMAIDQVFSVTFDPGVRGIEAERLQRFQRALLERLDTAPGIERASLAEIRPLSLSRMAGTFLPDGAAAPVEGQPTGSLDHNTVAPGYFETMGIAQRQGRDFAWSDAPGTGEKAILNASAAKRLWPELPESQAVGQRLRRWRGREGFGPVIEVVGVVADSKYASVGEDQRAMIFFPATQHVPGIASLVIRTEGAPHTALPIVQAAVSELDPDLPLFDVGSMRELSALSLLPARAAGILLATLGSLTLGLAAIGLYGVVAFVTRQRRQEFGIRLALGAERRDIRRLVLLQGTRWLAVGLCIGLGVALAAMQVLRGWLYGISPADPATYAFVIAVLATVRLAASLAPARAAARVDPLAVLRAD